MRCYLAFAVVALFVIAASADIQQGEPERADLGSDVGLEGLGRALKNCVGSSCGGFWFNRQSGQFFRCGISQFGSFFPCGVNNGLIRNGFTFSNIRQPFFSGFRNIGLGGLGGVGNFGNIGGFRGVGNLGNIGGFRGVGNLGNIGGFRGVGGFDRFRG